MHFLQPNPFLNKKFKFRLEVYIENLYDIAVLPQLEMVAASQWNTCFEGFGCIKLCSKLTTFKYRHKHKTIHEKLQS